MFGDIRVENVKRSHYLGFISAPHPVLLIAALERRHPGLTPAIESYIQSQHDSPTFLAVIETALHSFLTLQDYLPSSQKLLRITPAEQGNGYSSTSIEHGRVMENLDLENLA